MKHTLQALALGAVLGLFSCASPGKTADVLSNPTSVFVVEASGGA